MPSKSRRLARDWKLEIDTGDGTWIKVAGLQEITETIDATTADATDLDDGVWASDMITGRSWNIACTGVVTGTRDASGVFTQDPGQAALADMATLAGDEATILVRRVLRDPENPAGHLGGRQGLASVSVPGSGGNRTALDPFNPTFTGAGAYEAIAADDGVTEP